MNWKNFLKPTLWKIILTAIILMGLLFLPIVPVKIQVLCIKGPCYPIEENVSGVSILYGILYPRDVSGLYMSTEAATWIVLLLEVIISYFSSCFVFEIKKRK